MNRKMIEKIKISKLKFRKKYQIDSKKWNDVENSFHSNEKFWNDKNFFRNDVEMKIFFISFEWNKKNSHFDHNFIEELSSHSAT